MRAFLKTPFGDSAIFAVMVIVLAFGLAMVVHHLLVAAALVAPFAVLLGVVWLVKD
jgi:hypothetical protein